MNALMAEILEGHVRLHLLHPDVQKDPARAAAAEEFGRGHQEISKVTGLLIMKTTSKRIHSVGQLMDDKHDYHHHSPGHHQDHDHDQEHDDHDHETGTAEYVRLGLMGIIVIASLTGW